MSTKSDRINRQRIIDIKGHNEILMRDIKKDRVLVKSHSHVLPKEILEAFSNEKGFYINKVDPNKYFKGTM
jgi:hypothetical protein